VEDRRCSVHVFLDALAVTVVGVTGGHRAVHDLDQTLVLVARIYALTFRSRIAVIVINEGFTIGAG
jgi:hypothetical protein